MKTFIFFVFLITVIFCGEAFAQIASVDALYRNLVRSDNSGYLPNYVQNRGAEIDVSPKDGALLPKTDVEKQAQEIIELENVRRAKRLAAKKEREKWNKTVEAAKNNSLTPAHIQEIAKRAKENDPQALEIFAFLNARGQGMKQNLTEAYVAYSKAAKLGVKKAEENAKAVYGAMNAQQRAELEAQNLR